MSLKYTCDVCGEDVEPGDTYGPGVITETPGQGRPMIWQPEEWPMMRAADEQVKLPALSVLPYLEESSNQICGACVGRLMREMVEALWSPEPANEYTATEYLEEFGERSDNGDRADSDVPELRAEQPVPQSSADAIPCSSCHILGIHPPTNWCAQPEFHSAWRGSRSDGGPTG